MIKDIVLRILYNGRGEQTIEAEIIATNGKGRSIASTGRTLGEKESKFAQQNLASCIKNFRRIVLPNLLGMDVMEQERIDGLLNANLKLIGKRLSCSVSLAAIKAAASSNNVHLYEYLNRGTEFYLPYPLGNVIGGWGHAEGGADIQETMVLPLTVKTVSEAIRINIRLHEKVGKLIKKFDAYFVGGRDDEGAWICNLPDKKVLDIVSQVCDTMLEETGIVVKIGVDLAATILWDKNKETYIYKNEGIQRKTPEQIDFIRKLIENYDLYYIEDPFHERDFQSFKILTEQKGDKMLIAGDDLFVSDHKTLAKAVKHSACNSIIIKPDQAGTFTNLLKIVDLSKKEGYVPIISHRSGDTCDTTIVHLAVGLKCPIIKMGVIGGERTSKANELLRIEEEKNGRVRLNQSIKKITYHLNHESSKNS